MYHHPTDKGLKGARGGAGAAGAVECWKTCGHQPTESKEVGLPTCSQHAEANMNRAAKAMTARRRCGCCRKRGLSNWFIQHTFAQGMRAP